MEADLHVHSIASGHALNTVYELASVACYRKLKLIGIVDHGPDMEGAPHAGYFEIAQYSPLEISGITVLIGCECNIISINGHIDLPWEYLRVQKIIFLGLHSRTSYKGTTKEDHTNAIINAIKTAPQVHAISHPFRPEFPTDIEEVVKASSEVGVALEVNCFVLQKCNYHPKVIKQYVKMINLAREYNVPLVVSSDAHIASQIGDFYPIERAKLGFLLNNTSYMVINRSVNSTVNFLSRRGIKL